MTISIRWTEIGPLSTGVDVSARGRIGPCFARHYGKPAQRGAVVDEHGHPVTVPAFAPPRRFTTSALRDLAGVGHVAVGHYPHFAACRASTDTPCEDAARRGAPARWSATTIPAAPGPGAYQDQIEADHVAWAMTESFDPAALAWHGLVLPAGDRRPPARTLLTAGSVGAGSTRR